MLKRPILSFAVSLIAGISVVFGYLPILASGGQLTVILSAIAMMIVISTAVYIFIKFEPHRLAIAGSALFFILGMLSIFISRNSIYYRFSEFDGKEVFLTGVIDSAADIKPGTVSSNSGYDQKSSYTLNVSEIRYEYSNKIVKRKGSIILNIYSKDPSELKYGTKVTLLAVISMPAEIRNPGGFDYRCYLAGKKVSAIAVLSTDGIVFKSEGNGSLIKKAGLTVRSAILNVIRSSLPEKQAGLLSAMLIGYRDDISDEVNRDFNIAGLTHLMAVSGANIAFLAMPLLFLLKKVKVRRCPANIITSFFLIFFLFITGFEASVTRAVIMAITVLAGQIFYREADTVSNLSFSCIVLLVINPFTLFNAGFQLSFAATLSLVLFNPYFRKLVSRRYLPKFITDTFASTVAAQVGVLPLLVCYFHRISIISVLSNILILPMVELTTITGALTALAGLAGSFASKIIGYAACSLLTAILEITRISASLPFASVTTSRPPYIIIMIYYTLIFFNFRIRPRSGIKFSPAAVIASICILGSVILLSYTLPISHDLEITVLDVGEGDSIFIRTPEGLNILIDTGPGGEGKYDAGSGIVAPFLFYKDIYRLDSVIITHPHTDHSGGLPSILAEFEVKNIILPYTLNQSVQTAQASSSDNLLDKGLAAIISDAGSKGTGITYCSSGARMLCSKSLALEVISPQKDSIQDSGKNSLNDQSLVLKLTYGSFSMLFMGDAEEPVEKRLISCNIKADVLKIGHHGSSTSTSEAFLEAVSPEAAIISVGRNNFGHPSDKVLQRLKSDGVRICRTDNCGAVTVKTDGRGFRVSGMIRRIE